MVFAELYDYLLDGMMYLLHYQNTDPNYIYRGFRTEVFELTECVMLH